MTLLSTLASVEVIADWAPMTSLLRRLTSAPVRVRVKNATGIRWTCAYTALRRSTISPSPMREENHRDTSPVTASSTASAAMPAASPTTVAAAAETCPPATTAFTTRPASTGVATPIPAPTTVSSRNASSQRR